MALNDQHREGVRRAITDLLEGHVANPFHVLRERGAVAELRQRLLQDPALNVPVPAQVTRFKPWPVHRSDLPQQFMANVLPVQLELSVSAPSTATRASSFSKDVDIGILAAAPELRIAPNGPGDVLQQVEPRSLAAAIEVKACPTVDPVQRGLCVEDIRALLR